MLNREKNCYPEKNDIDEPQERRFEPEKGHGPKSIQNQLGKEKD
jgi:hypothetical protein